MEITCTVESLLHIGEGELLLLILSGDIMCEEQFQ